MDQIQVWALTAWGTALVDKGWNVGTGRVVLSDGGRTCGRVPPATMSLCIAGEGPGLGSAAPGEGPGCRQVLPKTSPKMESPAGPGAIANVKTMG